MDIAFLHTDSPNNMLNKNYTPVAGFDTIYARNNVSLVTPDITLETTPAVTNEANYAYISEFGRFYFIESREVLNNGLMRFQLRCDVLMTFQGDILDCHGIVDRQKDNYDMYIKDQMIPVDCRKAVTYRKFQYSPFGLPYLSMLVVGGN